MLKSTIAFVVCAFALSLAGCGNDNEEACKDYVKKIQDCGGTYASTYNDTWCEAYDDTTCDVADYFDCLSSAMGECSGGTFPSADGTAISACASKATCA